MIYAENQKPLKLSSIIVTGPELTRETSMSAPNTPLSILP